MSRTTYIFRNGELVEKPRKRGDVIAAIVPPGKYTATLERVDFNQKTGSIRYRLSNVEPARK